MHTAIGVFPTQESAAAAHEVLLERFVPPQEIVFLTRSEDQEDSAVERGRRMFGAMGAAAGMTAGVGAGVLLFVPGIGQVLAMGIGAAALLGVAGAHAGAALGKVSEEANPVHPTPEAKCAEDVEFFRNVLLQGYSLLVVRTESQEVANVANGLLSRRGITMSDERRAQVQLAKREVGDVTVIDISGRITFLEGSGQLRQMVREAVEANHKKILFNMHEVDYVDSTGLGELVKSYTTVRSQGGHLKLVQVSPRVSELLQLTKLNLVLDIEAEESAALQSFSNQATAKQTA